MKIFISIVFVLMSLFFVGASTYVDSGNVRFNIAKETVGAITLYVRADGADTNTCLADTSGGACLTIQAALDKIPKNIKHAVTVNIGAGNFAGFSIIGFTVPRYLGTFTIQGNLDAPTLSTGTTSGTADGGSVSQCVHSTQSWTVNELRGRLVYVNSEYRVIRTNNGTTLNLVGDLGATCSGKAYQIYEQKTIINSGSALYSSAGIVLTSNDSGRDKLIIQNIAVTGRTLGIMAYNTDGLTIQQTKTTSNAYGIVFQSVWGETLINDNYAASNSGNGFTYSGVIGQVREVREYAYSNTAYGFYIGYVKNYIYGTSIYSDNNGTGIWAGTSNAINFTDVYAENNTSYGIVLEDTLFSYVTNIQANNNGGNGLQLIANTGAYINSGTISGNTGYGIAAGDQSYSGNTQGGVHIRTVTVSTNTVGGILIAYGVAAIITGVTGSSTGYGLTLDSGALAIVTSTTAVTGTLGNATIDAGSTVLTWVTDFATNGDAAVNDLTGARILRKD